MTIDSIRFRIPWWINPRYPMGRWDYFKTSVLLLIACGIAWLFTCLLFGVFLAYLTQDPNIWEKISEEKIGFTFLPFLLILIPLDFRRCRAAKIPFEVVWVSLGLSICDIVISSEGINAISLINIGIFLWFQFAPNRMNIISSNPDKEAA